MFSLIRTAKCCFNSISKATSVRYAIPTPKVYNYMSTASVPRLFMPYQQSNFLRNPCYTLTGKLKLFSNFSGFSPSQTLSSERSLLKVKESCANTTRTVTKFTLSKGTKRSVGTVLQRFYRLNNGLWIRRIGGYKKKLYAQPESRKFYLKQHVVCARYQCEMLDKMVTDYWKKPKYYIDDPYEPYHVRHNIDYVLPFKRRLKGKRNGKL